MYGLPWARPAGVARTPKRCYISTSTDAVMCRHGSGSKADSNVRPSAPSVINRKSIGKERYMDQRTSLRFQLISAWCGPAFLVTFVLFWGVIGRNIPNPSPALSAADLAARYSQHLGEIRLGFIVALITVCLYMPWCSYISARMARIAGGYPVLANLQ